MRRSRCIPTVIFISLVALSCAAAPNGSHLGRAPAAMIDRAAPRVHFARADSDPPSSTSSPSASTTSTSTSASAPATSTSTSTTSTSRSSSTSSTTTSSTSASASTSTTKTSTSTEATKTSSTTTTSSTQVSVTKTSTPPSTSSTKTSSTSSHTSTLTTTSVTTSTGDPVPATTLVIGSADATQVPSVTSIAPTASQSDGAASSPSGFFENKGAVAGTFTVVGLVGAGIVIFIAVTILRRRQRIRRQDEDDVYFDKFEPTSHVTEDPFGNNGLGGGGLGPSSTDLATVPADHTAYPDRGIEHGVEQYPMDEYGIGYPPGTAYAAALAQQGQPYQHPGYPYHDQPEQQQSEPAPADSLAIPRETAPREKYQQSIDSFYGNPGTARSSQVLP
ncbi:hypothetical protein PLICRDRAFT_169361 [Plicaturopsis crispa FD-325 SS-3]|nr:hypothetical protein PLICRDRAFT_169361 [Plicaturopsis crispa FD-325 SS-3]